MSGVQPDHKKQQRRAWGDGSVSGALALSACFSYKTQAGPGDLEEILLPRSLDFRIITT